MPRLLVNPGTPQQWEIALKPGLNTLGRNPACDVPIEEGSISGTHCQIAVNGDAVVVKDLGSTNGTFIERAPVSEAPLAAGQRLRLGSVEMQLLPDAAAAAAAPAATAAPAPIRLSVAAPSAAPAAPPAAPAPAGPPPPPAAGKPGLRLSVTAHAAPAAAPEPSAAPVIQGDGDYAATAEAPAMCKYHPKSPARWMCVPCHLHFCDLCVASRAGGAHTGKFCRRCSSECVEVALRLVPEGADKANFFVNIPKAFAYPFKGSGLIVLITGAVLFGFMDFVESILPARRLLLLRATLLIQVFYVGYLFAFQQRVVHTAAQGLDEPATWPEVSEFWSDVLRPFLQLLAAVLVSFGPALALLLWAGMDATSGGSPGGGKALLSIPLALAGAVYFPMALLAVAMFDNVVGLNPLVVVPAIFKVPLEYFAVLVVMALIFVVRVVQVLLLELLPIPVLPDLISAAFGLYFFTVEMRMLGLMYFAKRDRLGWFGRH